MSINSALILNTTLSLWEVRQESRRNRAGVSAQVC